MILEKNPHEKNEYGGGMNFEDYGVGGFGSEEREETVSSGHDVSDDDFFKKMMGKGNEFQNNLDMVKEAERKSLIKGEKSSFIVPKEDIAIPENVKSAVIAINHELEKFSNFGSEGGALIDPIKAYAVFDKIIRDAREERGLRTAGELITILDNIDVPKFAKSVLEQYKKDKKSGLGLN